MTGSEIVTRMATIKVTMIRSKTRIKRSWGSNKQQFSVGVGKRLCFLPMNSADYNLSTEFVPDEKETSCFALYGVSGA
jgi:hypothetical protein